MINLKGKERLPKEYQEVEYLEGNGQPYINLGINPTNKEVHIEFTPIEGQTVSNQGIFGARGVASANAYSYNVFYGVSGFNKVRLDWIGSSSVNIDLINPTDPYGIWNRIECKVNGDVVFNNVTYNVVNAKQAINYNMFLFAFNNVGNPSSLFKGRIRLFDVYENGELVMNLVPCYRKSDSKVGMYDLITKNFFYNAKTVGNDFTYGSIISGDPKNITINKDGNTYDCKRVVCNDTVVWEKASKYADRDMSYFTIKPSSALCILQIDKYGNASLTGLQYRKATNEEGTEFGDWITYNEGDQISNNNMPIQFNGLIRPSTWGAANYYNIHSNGQDFDVYGNLGSIMEAKGNYGYYRLFSGSTVVDASGLIIPPQPNANVWAYRYAEMFDGCSKLKYAPNISGRFANFALKYTFRNCTSLIKAPKITDTFTSIGNQAFYYTFSGCTSLQYPPMDFVLNMVSTQSHNSMFYNNTSLKITPKIIQTLKWESNSLDSSFRNCTSLTKADLSKIVQVGGNHCNYMFDGCSNLNYIKLGFVNAQNKAVTAMFRNVASSGTAVIRPEANQSVYSIIPSGWDIEYMDWTDMSVESFTPYVYNGGVETNINISFKEDELLIKTILLNNPTNYKVIFTDLDGNQTESSFYRDDFYVVGDYVQYSCESTKQGLYIDNGDCYLDSYDWDADEYAVTSIASVEIVRISDDFTVASYNLNEGIALMSLDEEETTKRTGRPGRIEIEVEAETEDEHEYIEDTD